MDEAHKLEIAGRIRDLRERSPFNQQNVADKLGIGLRAYQKVEEVGTTRYERCEELARIFKVDPMWIWEGDAKRGKTPDLMESLNGSGDRLIRIEEKQDAVLDAVERLAEKVEALVIAQAEAAAAAVEGRSRQRSAPGDGGGDPAAEAN